MIDKLGFSEPVSFGNVHSLFRSSVQPSEWSCRVPSILCMADPLTGIIPPLTHANDHDMFPLAFLFARKLDPVTKTLSGPMLVENAIDILCNAYQSPDLLEVQLDIFRSSYPNMMVSTALIRRCDYIGDTFNNLVQRLLSEITNASAVETLIFRNYNDMHDTLSKDKVQTKSIIVSRSAFMDFMDTYVMMEKITVVFKTAKAHMFSYFKNKNNKMEGPSSPDTAVDLTFFELYEKHFEVVFQMLTGILWRVQHEESNSTPVNIDKNNDPTECVFALNDSVRIMSLHFLMACTLNTAVTSVVELPSFEEAMNMTSSHETKRMCDLYNEAEFFEFAHSRQDRNRVAELFNENKNTMLRFHQSLEFTCRTIDFNPVISKFRDKLQESKKVPFNTQKFVDFKKMENTTSVTELVHMGSTLREIMTKIKHFSSMETNKTISETLNDYVQQVTNSSYSMSLSARCTQKTVTVSDSCENLMIIFGHLMNPQSELYLALQTHTDLFQDTLAILRQRVDMVYRDFMRGLSCHLICHTHDTVVAISDIDNIYITFCYATNLVKHANAWKESTINQDHSSFLRYDGRSKKNEVDAAGQIRMAVIMHSLSYFSMTRRLCVSSKEKQDLRAQCATLLYNQYMYCLVEMFVELMTNRDRRPSTFYVTLGNFAFLLTQNAFQMMKTYKAVLKPSFSVDA